MSAKSDKHLFWQRGVGLVFIVLIIVSIFGAHQSSVWALFHSQHRIPILLFGVDAADASRHTDTIIISVFDRINDNLSLISVPRDTRIKLKGYRFRRINEIFGYHYRKTKDRSLSAREVVNGIENLISSDEMKITLPYYFQVDYSGFTKTIDLMGGIWVRIKQPMHYDDFAGDYHFHKEPGTYLLDGQESLRYVRYRGKSGDRGRILRQQEFLRSMAKRLANPMMIFRVPQFIGAIRSSIHTNLSFWDVLYLASFSRHIRAKDLGFYILPGRPRGAYWQIREKATYGLVSRIILGQELDYEIIDTIVPQMDTITVKVWNASGHRGLAQIVTRFLRSEGFDVVEWGNYAVTQVPTRVVDRRGNLANAKKIAETLGVETTHSEFNAKALADVEVILGQNYQGEGVEN